MSLSKPERSALAWAIGLGIPILALALLAGCSSAESQIGEVERPPIHRYAAGAGAEAWLADVNLNGTHCIIYVGIALTCDFR